MEIINVIPKFKGIIIQNYLTINYNDQRQLHHYSQSIDVSTNLPNRDHLSLLIYNSVDERCAMYCLSIRMLQRYDHTIRYDG